MKKIYLLLLSVFALLNTAIAQKLSVESFVLAPTDLTAQTEGRKDLNGDACALVKISFVGDVLDVEGNVIKPLVKRNNETWAFMTQESRQMKVITKDYLPLMVTFGDYGIEKLQSNRTYVLTLAKPSGAQEPVDAGGNFYAISVQPKTAVLWIDGIQQEVSSDGEYSAMLAYGSHTYKVEAGGYISKSGSFTIGKGDMTPIFVSLVSALAILNVSCPTPAVSLYVDKKSVGSLPWNGNLKEGMHLLEVRKDGYRSQQKTIQLAQQQKLDVAFDALSAIQGNLSVNFKPFGSDVYVDGVKVGQSPRVFNGVLVGKHNVEVRKSGYTTSRQTVTISEGQTASISGSLTSSASSSNANVLSSGSSSPSGNTITIPVKNGISIEMVKVEAGSFNMGATPEMENPFDSEKPVHRVTLTNNYYIGKYEVTQALWQAVMGSNPSNFKGDDLPVEKVSWDDCQDFISKLNAMTGKRFRLPSEAEWEYAARGGNKSRGYQYSGSNVLRDVAWYSGNSSSRTHAVGTKQPNELGIYDMTGNVGEWCQDRHDNYSSSPQTNPTSAVSELGRVHRGGGWVDSARFCRSSCRLDFTPGLRCFYVGLRLVLSE
uniref:SUMF1/EgtB/PvdO family nonheme iron enzyme n=1 Tax=Prevotella sp. TaxID=59823 RepID=UPI004027480C